VGFTLWLTGLSAAGKSTLAGAVAAELGRRGLRVEILDGDQIRTTISKGLGFTRADRDENVRRIGLIARLLSRNGVVAIVAAMSPYRASREEVRAVHEAPFVEVFIDCPLEEVMRRDRRGLYARAIAGEVSDVIGVSAPYEAPLAPELHIRTDLTGVDEAQAVVVDWLETHGLVPAPIAGAGSAVSA
jgi:adenylyl-sulfate kinase